MKILIVDDEELTRNGLINNIAWEQLGITEVLQAEDGEKALAAAIREKPDILLTDVRMPHRNGISLAAELQKIYPDTSLIFMSGFSDKEYLKAAISLHAVRYVEKPIDLEEITDAISESINAILKQRQASHSHAFMQKESLSKLALSLTKPAEVTKEQLSSLPVPANGSGYFCTMILEIRPSLTECTDEQISCYLGRIDEVISLHHLKQIHTIKHEHYLILHLISSKSLDNSVKRRIGLECIQLFQNSDSCIGSIGRTVTSIQKLSQSYNSAVILLQSGFFYENMALLMEDDEASHLTVSAMAQMEERIVQSLLHQSFDEATQLELAMYQALHHNRDLLPDQAKDSYYRLLSAIQSASASARLTTLPGADQGTILSLVSACRNMDALHQLFHSRFKLFLQQMSDTSTETVSPIIFQIQDYIRKNYGDVSLSIKDISDHVHLSTSYLCTLFKSETGTTLNQYITEYRLERAKHLLRDPRYKIADISSQVGYQDGNYFGKSFKKAVGLSPSEFRERELS